MLFRVIVVLVNKLNVQLFIITNSLEATDVILAIWNYEEQNLAKLSFQEQIYYVNQIVEYIVYNE